MLTNLVREDRRTLKISVDRYGEMHIVAPKNMPLADIVDFVTRKEKWIHKRQTAKKELVNKNKVILEYEKYLYLGEAYEPVFSNVKTISIENNYLLIPIKYKDKEKKAVVKFLKERALYIIENRLLHLAASFNLKFGAVSLINSKNRWGTASPQRELSFNWRLIMLPPPIIDYVICHELSHLVELNHSPRFYAVLEKMMPTYKKHSKDLKDSVHVLELFRD
ncbi:MAG: M48 family metallopeptidase [Firmicutes bacterium]|nr:M48 family metallopeptidase [Bacillota bacterium]MCL2771062.1 M48 family metallopeptidase [Bacillota bacterium]